MVAHHTGLKPKEKGPTTSESERYAQACAEVANHLIQLHEESGGKGKDVNLNSLRGTVAKKFKLTRTPPLTDIIAAVPEHYKKYIVPKLVAKPVST